MKSMRPQGHEERICDIIRACGKFGVAKFIYGNLEIIFNKELVTEFDKKPEVIYDSFANETGQLLKKDDSINKENEEILSEQDERDLLMINDPEEYERQEEIAHHNFKE